MPPRLPDPKAPELKAVPPVLKMTVIDVVAGNVTTEPEPAFPDAPPVPTMLPEAT